MKTATSRAGMKKPKWWIDDIVVRALADYVAAPNVLHKAFAVTVFANHIADRMFHYYDEHDKSALLGATSEGGFLKAIIAAFPSHPDLQYVHDGADSIKHHFLFAPRTGSATRFPSTATDAMTATTSGFEIVVPSGNRPVEDAVRNVVDFWRSWLTSNPVT